MALIYTLFALTASMVLIGVLRNRIPVQGRGEAFIALFILFGLAAWAVNAWVLPAVAGKAVWLPVLFLVLFGALLGASMVLSFRMPKTALRVAVRRGTRMEGEAIAFDVLYWAAFVAAGIAIMRAIGM